jgi:hypothetical protein
MDREEDFTIDDISTSGSFSYGGAVQDAHGMWNFPIQASGMIMINDMYMPPQHTKGRRWITKDETERS